MKLFFSVTTYHGIDVDHEKLIEICANAGARMHPTGQGFFMTIGRLVAEVAKTGLYKLPSGFNSEDANKVVFFPFQSRSEYEEHKRKNETCAGA